MKTLCRLATVALLLLPLFAGRAATAADPARGESLFTSRCGACHSLDTDRVGPRLGGVYGRPAGSVDGYGYSAALRGSGLVWDDATLDGWLAGPFAYLPGALMPFAVSVAADRDDIIAFLRVQAAR
ncbi:MAG: c-type cytochrome [Alphaproteobacteria bacterium]